MIKEESKESPSSSNQSLQNQSAWLLCSSTESQPAQEPKQIDQRQFGNLCVFDNPKVRASELLTEKDFKVANKNIQDILQKQSDNKSRTMHFRRSHSSSELKLAKGETKFRADSFCEPMKCDAKPGPDGLKCKQKLGFKKKNSESGGL